QIRQFLIGELREGGHDAPRLLHGALHLREAQSATREIGSESAFTHATVAVQAGACLPDRLAPCGVALRRVLSGGDCVGKWKQRKQSERRDKFLHLQISLSFLGALAQTPK